MFNAPDIPVDTNHDLVTFRITTGDDGQAVDSTVNIHSILIQKEVNKIPFARIRILDGDTAAADFSVSDTGQFIPGKAIRVSMGYHGEDTLLFKGIIISHANRVNNNCAETTIECKDQAVKMTIAPKNKHYNDVTDSDIAEELTGNYGLDSDVASTSVTNHNLVQHNMTDWDFMVSRMDRLGMITLVNDGKITIQAPDIQNSAALDVQYGDNILEFHADIDARYQVKNVKVSSWNSQTQSVETTDSDYDGDTGGNLSAGQVSDALNVDQLDIRSSAPLTEEERKAVANARKMKNTLAKIRGSVKFLGHSDIHQGDVLTLKGVGDRFNGPAFVSALKHEYAEGDWTTEATLGMSPEWFAARVSGQPGSGALADTPGAAPTGSAPANTATGLYSTIQGLQTGIVTDIVDPDNEFRVRIKLPAVNADEDGIWARVGTLDAGNNRGTYFRPETNDEVIVGFINNDPSYPVILGMMHSSALPSPITPASDNNEKGYQSREGLKLNFHDGDKAVKIETPAGKKITLSESDGVIKIEDENNNTLSLDSSGITIKSASDLKIQATGTLTLSGASISISGNSDLGISATSVSISGSGTTEISGGIVKIN